MIKTSHMKNYWPAWIGSFLFTAIAAIIVTKVFPIPRIIRLELAPNAEMMGTYIKSIAPTYDGSYHILFMNSIVDFAFLIGYTLLTFYSFKILLGVFDAPAGKWVYIIAGLTGFFDVLENSFLIRSAIHHHAEFSCFFYWIVRVKWACAIIPLMIIPVALLYGIITYLTRDNKK